MASGRERDQAESGERGPDSGPERRVKPAAAQTSVAPEVGPVAPEQPVESESGVNDQREWIEEEAEGEHEPPGRLPGTGFWSAARLRDVAIDDQDRHGPREDLAVSTARGHAPESEHRRANRPDKRG